MSEVETWKPIPGYEGSYKVSSYGRVLSMGRKDTRGRRRGERELKPRFARSGHSAVALYVNGTRRDALIHHLVLESFVGPRPDGMEGCHWNDDPSDNSLGNLRWDTRSANILDSVRNGTHGMARRTHCPQGHEYTGENTYIHPSGSRMCNTCRREYREAHYEQRRASGRLYMQRVRAMRAAKSTELGKVA